MNTQPNEHPNRRSIRLHEYNYSLPGGYFVTIVIQSRLSLFGEIRSQEMSLNPAGQMVHAAWQSLPERFPNLEIDIFQVMPNHFHGILIIHESVGVGLVPTHDKNHRENAGAGIIVPEGYVPARISRATTRVAPTDGDETQANQRGASTLGQIIGAFKSITTHEYIQGVEKFGWPRFEKRLWQRNYYEHILRDQTDYEQKAGYVFDNPANWEKDDENPKSATGNLISPE